MNQNKYTTGSDLNHRPDRNPSIKKNGPEIRKTPKSRLSRSAQTAAALLAAAMMAAGCSSVPAGLENTENTDASEKIASQQAGRQAEQNASESDASETKDDDIEFEGVSMDPGTIDVSSLNDNLILTKAGTYTISGKMTHTIVVDAGKEDDMTLVLDSLQTENSGSPAIYVRKASSVTLSLRGSSEFQTESDEILNASIYSKSDLTIEGDGSLKITETAGHGIKAKDSLMIEDADLDIHALKDGIHVNEDAEIAGNLNIVSDEDEGIQSELSLLFRDGSYTVESAGDCFRAEENLIIEKGTYQLISSENEGIESKSTLHIKDGTFRISAWDDGLNAASSLIIDGGTLNVSSENNDGIDSNGDLIINGGRVEAEAMKMPEGPFDTDNTPFEIHGGTVFGIGAELSMPTDSDQIQVAFSLKDQNVSSLKITVDGQSVFERSVQQDKQKKDQDSEQNQAGMRGGPSNGSVSAFFTSDQLKEGSAIEILADGETLYSGTLVSGLNTFGSVQVFGQRPDTGGRFSEDSQPPMMDDESGKAGRQIPPEGNMPENSESQFDQRMPENRRGSLKEDSDSR